MSFFKPDDAWVLWAFLIGWAAASIWMEQKFKWASKVTGAIIALLGAIILANLNIIPKAAPTYDAVWVYVVPVAVPLLLYKANIKHIWKESGRMLGAFYIGALGTFIGAFIATFIFRDTIPEVAKVAGMMTGSYIGGGVNFVAMTAAFNTSENIVNATIVADNFVMALYFFILIAIPGIGFIRKRFNTPYEDLVDRHEAAGNSDEMKTKAAMYWGKKEISLQDIALAMGSAVVIVAVSVKLAAFFEAVIPTSNWFAQIFNSLLGNKYLVITTLTMILASTFPNFFGNLKSAQELGTFLIYIFFVVIGVPASLTEIVKNSPLLFVYCFVIVLVNLLVLLVVGRLFKFNLEELLLSGNANIGGPTTAVAMAIAKGWNELVIPVMLAGISGYIVGNYLGIIAGNILINLV